MSRPKLSRGYVPASAEELEALISGDALQLLLRIRRKSDERESDGLIPTRHLNALAVEHGMTANATDAAIAELVTAKLLRQRQDGYQDINFSQWCRSADKRNEQRAGWRARQKKHRSQGDSEGDSERESPPVEKEVKEEEQEKKAAAAIEVVASAA